MLQGRKLGINAKVTGRFRLPKRLKALLAEPGSKPWAERFESGELIDISDFAKAVGFVFPVLITRTAWAEAIGASENSDAEANDLRFQERQIVEILLQAIKVCSGEDALDTARFSIYQVLNREERRQAGRLVKRVDLLVQCWTGKHGNAEVTISLANSS